MLSPTDIKAFGIHLYNEGDYRRAIAELERYQYLTESFNDTAQFIIGDCYQRLSDYQIAADRFWELSTRTENEELVYFADRKKLENLYLAKDWEALAVISPENDISFFYHYYSQSRLGNSISDNTIQKFVKDSLLLAQYLRLNHRSLSTKSPIVAGVLSSVVPGLGKVYHGRVIDGVYGCVFTIGAGLASYYSEQEGRIYFSAITRMMTLGFYAGTIYGSYTGVEKYNDQIEENWYRDLEELRPESIRLDWLN